MKKSIKELIKEYLKRNRRWHSHQELESLGNVFGCCGSTVMRKLRDLYRFDPSIDRKINGVVYYKYRNI